MIKINSSGLLEEALSTDDAIIFKHSTSCPISFRAHRQVIAFQNDHPKKNLYIVDVIRDRQLSQEIARRLHVRHESPQIIVVRNSEAIWDASHSGVNADAIKDATNLSQKEH